jgi:hypothetical protein
MLLEGLMRIILAAFLVAFLSPPALAHGENRVLFLDGARIEQEYVARKGLIDVPLPAAMLHDSFRVKPLGGATIRRVEIGPYPSDRNVAKKLSDLEDRREVLLDRIKILDEREGIFKSAAKSQSGRALRKTKGNPDPLSLLRTGTRFALSQLDEVSAARRQTRKDLATVETRIAVLEKQASPRNRARVWLSKPDGKVVIAYLVSNLKWTPWYDFRLSGNGYVEIELCAKISSPDRNISTSVVPLPLSESYGSKVVPYPVSSEFAGIASFRFPLVKEAVTEGAVPSLSFLFTNSTGQNLPSGAASGYWQGEYFGMSSFAGCLPGKSLSLVFGKQ